MVTRRLRGEKQRQLIKYAKLQYLRHIWQFNKNAVHWKFWQMPNSFLTTKSIHLLIIHAKSTNQICTNTISLSYLTIQPKKKSKQGLGYMPNQYLIVELIHLLIIHANQLMNYAYASMLYFQNSCSKKKWLTIKVCLLFMARLSLQHMRIRYQIKGKSLYFTDV